MPNTRKQNQWLDLKGWKIGKLQHLSKICSTSYIDDKVENRTPLTDDTCEQTTTDLDIVYEHTNTDPADTGEHTTTHHDDIFSSLLHF